MDITICSSWLLFISSVIYYYFFCSIFYSSSSFSSTFFFPVIFGYLLIDSMFFCKIFLFLIFLIPSSQCVSFTPWDYLFYHHSAFFEEVSTSLYHKLFIHFFYSSFIVRRVLFIPNCCNYSFRSRYIQQFSIVFPLGDGFEVEVQYGHKLLDNDNYII